MRRVRQRSIATRSRKTLSSAPDLSLKEKLVEYLKGRVTKKDGKYAEAFRRATGFNPR